MSARRSTLFRALCSFCVVAGMTVVGKGDAAFAHRLNLITTDIQWRAEPQALEVTHRFHLDDALSLLAHLGAADGVLDREASARLLLYVEAQFDLATRDGPLTLEPLGAHIQGAVLEVFQQVSVSRAPQALEVRNELMHDLAERMNTHSHFRYGDEVRSHQGHPGNALGWLVVELPTAAPATP